MYLYPLGACWRLRTPYQRDGPYDRKLGGETQCGGSGLFVSDLEPLHLDLSYDPYHVPISCQSQTDTVTFTMATYVASLNLPSN